MGAIMSIAELSDPDPDVRYDACRAVAKLSSVEAAVVEVLVSALVDRQYGTEYWDRGAGSEPVYLPISNAAADALVIHGRQHRAVLERAFRDASTELRAALVAVLPSSAPHGEITMLVRHPDAEIRLAAVERLDAIQFDALLPFWSEPFVPSAAFEERAADLAAVFRALLDAMDDPDPRVARRAAPCRPGNRSDRRGDAARALCFARAGEAK